MIDLTPWCCTCGTRFPDSHRAITVDMPTHTINQPKHTVRKLARKQP